MSRYQSIVSKLQKINEAAFQELCDRFLVLRNRNYSAFSRTGSQAGKQKTTKGTPDSFFLLPNHHYMYVEMTTNVTDKGKLSKDIEACFDSKKTKIPIERIEEIILCFNFNIDQKHVEELVNLARGFKKDIKISFWSLDALAIELHMNHRDLVYDYLGLALDTGQIVSIERFINEYNRAAKGISTPLDNDFVHREKEKEGLKQAILNSDFIILTGSPGVGKTKLAIETVSEFLNENAGYEAYCISYKSHTLLDDLYQYFDMEKDYLLFIDDANRIDAFNQIVGFYKAVRKGRLKIIITVRDYAFQKIGSLCYEYDPIRIDIYKLTDEQITDIIKAQPFEILNFDYQKEIIRIADGNPRLAVMASLLAKAEQNLYVLSDVTDLFEKYFSTFVKDESEFANIFNIKCLGIIAFFYTIPYKNKKLLSTMLEDFSIGYSDFIDAIDKLEKLELVDIQYEHAKIPEQNLSTYFFYKSFIKDQLLSFQKLLEKYFDINADRFRDCVIAANNTFGPQNVMDKLRPYLQKYWAAIRNDQDKAYKFLSTFWFYLESETLEFVYSQICSLPIPEIVGYEVSYDKNEFSYDRDRTIELLGEFFIFPHILKDALELAFEYTRRFPKHLPELIHKIREELTFDRIDESTGFLRQSVLFDLIIQKLKNGDSLYKTAFFELAKTFLEFKHHQTKGGINKSFYWYDYPIPNTQEIRDFRRKIWGVVNDYFSENPDKSLDLLSSYASVTPDVIQEIIKLDAPYVLEIIDNYLSPKSFDHCRYVQDQIRWFKRNGISNNSFSRYLKKFTNPIYEIFLKIDWDRLRDKEMYDFEDYDEYEKLKEAEIRSSFIFRNKEEAKSFYKSFVFLKAKAKDDWRYGVAIDHVIDENFRKKFEIGIQLLGEIIEKNNEIGYVPQVVFRNQLNTKEKTDEIWNLVQKRPFKYKSQWELSFYDYINESLINGDHPLAIIDSIGRIEEPITIHFDRLARFLKEDPNLFQKILKAITERNNKSEIKVRTWIDLFTEHFDKLGNDLGCIKKAYLQQNSIQSHFDYRGKGFLRILKKDSNFLINFINSLYSKEKKTRLAGDHRDMSFVWEVKDIEKQLIQVIDIIIKKETYFGILEHFCNCFFRNLRDEKKDRADKFLREYVLANYKDHNKMNVIVDIVRNSREELFESILLLYISMNQSAKDFSRIFWRGSGSTYRGDVIIGDIEAAEWKNILSIVEKSDQGIKLIPIKKYLNEVIEECLARGDWERQRRFLERD